jgi:SAM-dependent methyltransferase
MKWRQKALLFRLLPTSAHYWAQRYVTRSLPRPRHKMPEYNRDYIRHMDVFRRYRGPDLAEKTLFEFGAGWDLCAQIAFWCLGIQRQIAVDLNRLVRREAINDVIDYYQEHGIEGEVRRPTVGIGPGIEGDLRRAYGVTYRAPYDAGATDLQAGSIDLVASTNTLEHIPPADIERIMTECRRICAPAAILSLRIDYQDHWAYADRSISVYNFLRFEEEEWTRWNPAQHFQNRLRHGDYRRLFRSAGFVVLEEEAVISEDGLAQVSNTPLARRFDSYAPADLAATAGCFVLRPAGK